VGPVLRFGGARRAGELGAAVIFSGCQRSARRVTYPGNDSDTDELDLRGLVEQGAHA
jgi:hypothetical protein